MPKPLYDILVKPRLADITEWVANGVFYEDIAKNLGINTSTLYNYQNSHSELFDALKKGKVISNVKVENALFQKAIGYTRKIQKNYKVKLPVIVEGVKIADREGIITKEEEVYFPPDTAAQIFWLRNRNAEEWKNNPELLDDTPKSAAAEIAKAFKAAVSELGENDNTDCETI